MQRIYPQRAPARPALLLPVLLLMAGIGVADMCVPPVSACGMSRLAWLLEAGLLCAAGLAVAGWRRRGWLAVVASVLFFVAGGVRLMTVRESASYDWPSERALTLRVLVRRVTRIKAGTLQADVQVQTGAYAGRRLRAGLIREAGDRVRPGDVLLLHGVVTAPSGSGNPGSFDYAAWLRRQGVEGTTFCYRRQWRQLGAAASVPFVVRLARWRQELVERYATRFGGEELAVLAALTLGDRSMLTPATHEVFSESGTSHLLALSGLHLSILFGSFCFLLRLLPGGRLRRWLTVALLPVVWLFVGLAGASLSLVRSAIMLSLVLLGRVLGRGSSAPDHLALAAFVILLVWPQALFDVGFQLSFLSVAGILLLSPMVPRLVLFGGTRELLRRGCGRVARAGAAVLTMLANSVLGLVAVSVCAQVATAPLVAGTFGSLPLYGVVASLVGIPLAYGVMVGAVLYLVFPPAAVVPEAALRWLTDGLSFVAAWPHASVTCHPSTLTVVLCYGVLLAAYAWWRSHRAGWLYCTAVLVAAFGASRLHARLVRAELPRMVFYQTFSAPTLHVIVSAERSFLWTTRPEKARQALAGVKASFWEPNGMAEPCLLRGDTLARGLHYAPHVLADDMRRVGLLYEPLPSSEGNPLRVSHLFLVRGYNRPLREALDAFRPDTLVLDASLSDFYRRRYHREAAGIGLPVHDLRRDGALVLH